MAPRRISIGLACLLLATATPRAQTAFAGVGVDHGIDRFTGDPNENRLDGHASGWTWVGGATLFSHLALEVEGSHGGRIVNTQVFSVDIDGRVPTIQSSLTHTTRSTAALAGFIHEPFARVHMIYLAGVSSTRVRRTFSTNAPAFILVSPSASNSSVTITVDDRTSFIGGADVIVQLAPHLGVRAGIRGQSLHLEPDLSGYNVRPMAALLWVF